MRAVVVGADGFAGRWLCRLLASRGDVVTALVGPRYVAPLEGASEVHPVDVREYGALSEVLVSVAPDAVYYLAAVSHAGGRERVLDAVGIGVVGAIHVLMACAEMGRTARMLYVSSAHVYGAGHAGPIPETAARQPSTVYGAAKAASEQALLALSGAASVEVVIARPFNHVGPGQSAGFLVPSVAAQVRSIQPGARGTVHLAAGDTVRDLCDVRDVVRAYRLLIEEGDAGGVYNIASGVGVSVRELVDTMLDVAQVEADVVVDQAVQRMGEPSALIGDPRLMESLGWQREIPLRSTLRDVLAG